MLQRQLSDLRVENLESRRVRRWFGAAKYISARTSNSCFHSVIWFGCTSNCSANSTSVLSPLSVAKATLALKSSP